MFSFHLQFIAMDKVRILSIHGGGNCGIILGNILKDNSKRIQNATYCDLTRMYRSDQLGTLIYITFFVFYLNNQNLLIAP